MFFKKGLRYSSLIHKLAIKNLRTSEEMLAITNKYTLAMEATLYNRDIKKDKEPSQSDRPGPSKINDEKRNPNRSMANVEQPRHSRTKYQSRPGEFEGFLDRICMFLPRENIRLGTATDCKGL
jgi:hypothetical protein